MWRFLVLLAASTVFTSNAFANPVIRTNVFFAQGFVFPVGLSPAPLGLPPSISEGVRVSRGMKLEGWSWMGEAGVSTSFTAVVPSVYVTTGPAQVLTDRFLLGEGISWKYTPSYAGAPASQTVGVALAPLFRVDFGSLTFPIGVGCVVSSTPTCSASIGAKFLVTLNQ